MFITQFSLDKALARYHERGRQWGFVSSRWMFPVAFVFPDPTATMIYRLASLVSLIAVSTTTAEPAPDFVRDVVPILQQHCIRCHQPGNKKGDFSLATEADLKASGHVVPGNPGRSLLWKVVQVPKDDERPRMPKQGKPLSDGEIGVLRRWIAEGARWPENYTIKERAKADAHWWSLQPIRNIDPPAPKDLPADWSRNPIDRFVFSKLQEKQLKPNRPADKRTLIRRVTYDLTGLPPTLSEVDAFLKDDAPDAYDKVITRLLASPQYGEQWGRHWLDVVRFGESNGYERNVLTPNLWPFRDYIIKSFRNDRPFDQLVLEHLAGDVVAKDDPDREVGTAFLVCGPYDNVGNSDAVQRALIRANHLDEMIRATSETFLGMTFGCARCHDHKFDPITQRDYYAMYATFAGVSHGDRPLMSKQQRADLEAKKIAPNSIPRVWAGNFDAAAAKQSVTIFLGGDPQKKGAVVTPTSMAVLDPFPAKYELTANATEPDRRLALAKWIIAKDHPLTSRVLANRVWHYHFGTGLVDTPSDFGWIGSKPTHPELLDWLAREIQSGGWKLKPIHRLIVTSQTYRQASTWNADSAKSDADARYWWRFPPRRLTGEEVRDTMLLLAGKLDLAKEQGGPGFQLYKYVQDNVATYIPLDEHGPATYRRAVYHQNARAARTDVLSDFDCPDPASAAPRRASTTTPLQALTLLNHRFTHDMAKFLSERVVKEAGEKVEDQVKLAFLLAYGRPVATEELQRTVPVVQRHGLHVLCLALLNSNELIYLP